MDTSPRPKNYDNGPVALEQRWASWHDDGLPVDIARSLTLAQTHTRRTADQLEALAGDLDTFLDRYERPHVAVDRWLATAETWEDRLDRRATVATLERLSGLRHTPLPWPGWSAPEGTPRKRVMRDLEQGLLRIHVRLYDSRRVATTALLEAGAISGELAVVTAQCCDGPQVHLPGSARTQARTVTIGSWARPVFDALVGSAPPSRPLLYTGQSCESDTIESSILMNFHKPFKQSGLHPDPTLAPMSVRHTGLRRIYDEQGWEACVAAAGVANWNRLRAAIGLT